MPCLSSGWRAITPEPALAAGGTHWDTVCNCRRPDSEYTTRRYVREAPRVHTHQRIVNHTNVVKRTRLIQENRLIVHVRPVINREVVVHRQNTIVRNITLHKVNTTNKLREEYRHETVNRYVRGCGARRERTSQCSRRKLQLRLGWRRSRHYQRRRRQRARFLPQIEPSSRPGNEFTASPGNGGAVFVDARAAAMLSMRWIGMAPRKSRFPTSTPQWRTMA